MNPFPLRTGPQPLGHGWSVVPPYPMAIREEEGATVIWHVSRGLTFWIRTYAIEPGSNARETLDWIRERQSPSGYDLLLEQEPPLLRYAYRLDEDGDAVCPTFCGFGIASDGGYVLFSAYFDAEESLVDALAAWRSLVWKA